MKNLHLLQIDTTSRLVKIYNDVNRENFTLKLDVEVNDSFKEYVNVYITSDEEIKEGDYVVQINFEKTNTQVIKCETEFQTKIANSKDGSFSKIK